jgi:hypothetical protein
VQHDEVAVLGGLDVRAGAVAAGELLVIESDANRRLGLEGTDERQQQWEDHGASPSSLDIPR